MEMIFNKKQIRCKICYGIHELFYQVQNNDTVHLIYQCDYKIQKGLAKHVLTIFTTFIAGLDIPFVEPISDLIKQEEKQKSLFE